MINTIKVYEYYNSENLFVFCTQTLNPEVEVHEDDRKAKRMLVVICTNSSEFQAGILHQLHHFWPSLLRVMQSSVRSHLHILDFLQSQRMRDCMHQLHRYCYQYSQYNREDGKVIWGYRCCCKNAISLGVQITLTDKAKLSSVDQ